MRSLRRAALCAAVLIPLCLTVPPAHADERFSGTNDHTEPPGAVTLPDNINDRCDVAGESGTIPLDVVSYASQSKGPRRFVLRSLDPAADGMALWVYRNGVCVGADLDDITSEDREPDVAFLDLEGVDFAVGDSVRVEIRLVPQQQGRWELIVEQPGTANVVTTGKAAKYVDLPYQVMCGTKKAKATFTKKGRKKVDSVVVKAGGRKVADTSKVSKKLKLKKIPARTTKLKVIATLESGKKVKAKRTYSAC